MKFYFDTEKSEVIQLHFDKEAGLEENYMDFCFGITAFFTDFCMQLGLDAKDATSLLGVCQSRMTQFLEDFISEGMLDQDVEEEKAEGVSADELDELEQDMRDAGFSDEEISNIIAFVQDAGSMDAALEALRGIGEEAGIDWTKSKG